MKCNLEEYFERRKSVFTGPFRAPATLVVKWAFDIAQAIKCLHGMAPKIIHRDIKPRNVLIAFNNAAILSDMGLCKVNIVNPPVSIHLRICLDISIDMALCEQTVEKENPGSTAFHSINFARSSQLWYVRKTLHRLACPSCFDAATAATFQRSNRLTRMKEEKRKQTKMRCAGVGGHAKEDRRYYSFRDR